MKKTVLYALSAALVTALVVPAFAQDNFPDVKENHWAYEALARMKKEGILVGFPDGLFRGARPATRYELAVAVNAVYMNLKNITDGLDSQIKAIDDQMAKGTGNGDLSDLRDQLKALQDQVDGMKNYGQDIDDLKKMTDKFEKELAAMGVDVDTMKKNLDDLDARVSKLEGMKPAFDIHGTFDADVIGAYSTSHEYGLTVDGRPEGVGRGNNAGVPVGLNKDLSVFHEGAMTISSTNTTGPKYSLTVAMGNVTGPTGFGNQSQTVAGPFSEGAESIYIQNATVTDDFMLGGLDFNVKLGRVGYKIDGYSFQRPDTTPYFSNDRWDNGEWAIDGGVLGFNFGKVGVDVIAGRTSDQNINNGTAGGYAQAPMTAGNDTGNYNYLSGLTPGAISVDQVLGANVSVPLAGYGKLDGYYLFLDSNSTTALAAGNANRVVDYGGSLDLKFNKFKVNGWYGKTDLKYNNSSIVNSDDSSYGGMLAYAATSWGLNVGYREIEPYFAAPGYWGRIGTWWNPTDIKGVQFGGHYTFGEKLTLEGMGEIDTGTGKVAGGLTTSDKIRDYNVDLKYNFTKGSDAMLGYERAEFNLAALSSTPYEEWYNIGVGFDLGNNTSLSVLWQISNYDGKGQAGFNVFGNGTAKGGLISTQLSVKF